MKRERDLPRVHVFHTHDDVAVRICKCTIKGNNKRRGAVLHDVKLPHDSFPHFLVLVDMNDLGWARDCVSKEYVGGGFKQIKRMKEA